MLAAVGRVHHLAADREHFAAIVEIAALDRVADNQQRGFDHAADRQDGELCVATETRAPRPTGSRPRQPASPVRRQWPPSSSAAPGCGGHERAAHWQRRHSSARTPPPAPGAGARPPESGLARPRRARRDRGHGPAGTSYVCTRRIARSLPSGPIASRVGNEVACLALSAFKDHLGRFQHRRPCGASRSNLNTRRRSVARGSR